MKLHSHQIIRNIYPIVKFSNIVRMSTCKCRIIVHMQSIIPNPPKIDNITQNISTTIGFSFIFIISQCIFIFLFSLSVPLKLIWYQFVCTINFLISSLYSLLNVCLGVSNLIGVFKNFCISLSPA